MANGLDAKGEWQREPLTRRRRRRWSHAEMGHEPADFSGLAVVEPRRSWRSSTSSSCATPASVDPSWRRYFQSTERQRRGNGAAARRRWRRRTAFRRSIFAGAAARPSAAGAGSRQPHVGPAAVRARAASGRGLPRARAPVRATWIRSGSCSASMPPIALEDFGLAEEDLDLVFSSENVAGPDRTTLRELIEPAARDLLPHHRRRVRPTCTTSSCASWLQQPHGDARATGWR